MNLGPGSYWNPLRALDLHGRYLRVFSPGDVTGGEPTGRHVLHPERNGTSVEVWHCWLKFFMTEDV